MLGAKYHLEGAESRYTNTASLNFDVNVLKREDPCSPDGGNTLSAPTLQDQTYLLTAEEVVYQIPAFISSAEGCQITYAYEVLEAGAPVSFDSSTFTFTFGVSDDLSLVQTTATEFEVIITAQTGTESILTEQASFKLTVSNPCLDADYVQIAPVPLPSDVSYIIAGDEHSFVHDLFTVTTSPTQHEL